jgi:protein transport protein SEC61 subunit gamma and related proteins
MIEKLKSFFWQCVRVWHVLRKPDMHEYKSISKISALGILAIGLVGFIVANIVNLLTV